MASRRVRQFVLRLVPVAAVLLAASPAWAAEEEGFYFGDLGQAIAAVVIFLLLLWLLGRYAWKPLVGQLQQREKTIADTIAGAQERQKEAEGLLAEYRRQLDKAQGQSDEILAKSRQEASAVRETILGEAREDARKCGEQMLADVDQARRSALRELYETTAELATEMAGRLVRKTLKPEDHRQLLTESLEEIRRRAGKG